MRGLELLCCSLRCLFKKEVFLFNVVFGLSQSIFKELSSSNEHICSFVVSVCVVMEQIWPEAIVESFELWKKEAGSQGTSDGESFFRSIIDSCSLLLSSEGALLIPSIASRMRRLQNIIQEPACWTRAF